MSQKATLSWGTRRFLNEGSLSGLLLGRPCGDYDGRNSAARAEISFDLGPDRLRPAHNILQDLVHNIFLENSEIPVGLQIFFQGFQLEAQATRLVTDYDISEIGQAGFRADGGEFRIVDDNFVSWKLIGPSLNFRELMIESSAGVFFCVARRFGASGFGHRNIVPRTGTSKSKSSKRMDQVPYTPKVLTCAINGAKARGGASN